MRFRAIRSAGALLVATLLACQSPDADRLWREGVELEQAGDVTQAVERYREAIASGDYDETRRYHFGALFVETRPLDEVVDYYRRAAEDPKPQTSHFFLARAFARHERFDEALRELQTALDIDPAHEMSHELWGDILIVQEDVEGALDHYVTAVEIHPELTSSHERLAKIYTVLGQTDAAARHRELALAGDPASPRRFFYWGRYLLHAGRVDAAIAELERAIEVDPDDEQARALLAKARLAAGNPE